MLADAHIIELGPLVPPFAEKPWVELSPTSAQGSKKMAENFTLFAIEKEIPPTSA